MTRTERQAHGFIFQDWIVGKFLDMFYTAKWDIPSEINKHTHKSVSIKTAQWKSSIGLGDVLTQFDINEDFELLVAFYEKIGDKKKVVNMQVVTILKEKWGELWGNMRREDLEKFDKMVRSSEGRHLTGEALDNFRAKVQQVKREIFKDYNGKFSINPKIDSKNQRRVQCGFPFNYFFDEFGLTPEKNKSYTLWGQEIKFKDVRLV